MLVKLWYYLIPHTYAEFYVDFNHGLPCIRLVREWLGRRYVIYDDTYSGGY